MEPPIALNVQDLAVQTLNVTLMFSVGLALERRRLRQAVRRWRLLAGGLALNFVAVPALAWALTRGLEAPIAAGLMLAAASPGGGTGTLLTRLAKGNLELSVVLLGLLTALAVPLTPLLVAGGGQLSLTPVLETLLVFQLTPLALGFGIRLASRRAAELANKVAAPLSNVVFVGLVAGLLVTRGHLVIQVGWRGLAVITALVVGSLAAGWALPGTIQDRSAISLTTAVRNLSLALLLSSTFLDDLSTLAILTYGLVMYLVAVPLSLVVKRRRMPLAPDRLGSS